MMSNKAYITREKMPDSICGTNGVIVNNEVENYKYILARQTKKHSSNIDDKAQERKNSRVGGDTVYNKVNFDH
jgi:hypothetical protein